MSFDQALFQSVCQRAQEAVILLTSAETLEWDQQTRMPSQAGEYRAKQVTALRGAAHRLQTNSKFGDDLKELSSQIADLDPHSDIAATITILHKDFERNRRLPQDLVERIAGARVRGQQIWEQAREADDYSMFRNALDEMIQLQRESGERIADGTDRTTYEALLDTYEPSARVEELQSVFAELRAPLVDLIAQIREAPENPDTECLKREFSIQAQREFSEFVAKQVGFDFERGRLDETTHPFCTTLGPSDCRILTRYEKTWLPSGLFGTLHEAGHGMYEQGLRTDEWFGLPPGSYASLGVHESQSRAWENQVGRSYAFWQWLFPEAKRQFAPTLDDVELNQFYRAVNSVQPSLIRVEADEATYNLHILIRFDLEQSLIDGSLTVDDLPTAWNDRYEQDLGIRPPSDASGVLQDVHWSAGLFGYFPTYTIGNLIGAQLCDAARRDLGDLDEQFRRGEFGSLLAWFQKNVHHHGKTRVGSELVVQATGESLSPGYLVDYLSEKLKPVYSL